MEDSVFTGEYTGAGGRRPVTGKHGRGERREKRRSGRERRNLRMVGRGQRRSGRVCKVRKRADLKVGQYTKKAA